MEQINSHDFAVFLTVVGLCILVPLLISRYPRPGVSAAFLVDAADQTIFQTQTRMPLEWYRGYDKALDVYYLTIAYCSTLRNWTTPFAHEINFVGADIANTRRLYQRN